MTTTYEPQRANKARLDNRWGCSVGLLSVTLTRRPVSTRTAAPAVPVLERSRRSSPQLHLQTTYRRSDVAPFG
jgi:hypothetical protein